MKSQITSRLKTEDKNEIALKKFCELLQFRFQIDKSGKPWLFDVKKDMTKFVLKGNNFDTFKKYLLIETILLIHKKIKHTEKEELKRLRTQKLLKQAQETTGTERILGNENIERYLYGDLRFTDYGKYEDAKVMQKEMDRVLGAKSVADEESIIKSFKEFDQTIIPDK